MSWTEKTYIYIHIYIYVIYRAAWVVPRFTLSQEQLDKKTVAALVLQEGAEVDQEECSACSENVSEYIRIVMAELTVCENRDKGGHGSTARWLS